MMPVLPDHFLFGAAYYPEYQAESRLKSDLDLMVEAQFNVIRVGESVWSTWEPENGVFDLDWLEPTLDGAHERGIAVVLGMPTYAAPPWLARAYPEINGRITTTDALGWGGRQEIDFTHPAFRFHAERVIRAILKRYATHPSVIGFQVDNEPGLYLLHNHGVFQRFVDDLRRRYGDVETLNREWGLVYWSHRLSTWADLWAPDGNAQPQYDLAWRRFQRELTDEFIGWQADLVREYSSPEQFVTTCISYERPAVDDETVTDRLDVTAGNPYYVMQDGLELPDEREVVQEWKTTGTWALFESADRMYSSRQEPFLVTETNAGHIGFPWDNRPAYDGQWRQAGWALAARGARMLEYWQWNSLAFGAETYWGGVLPHSGVPGRTYREIAQLGSELAVAGGALMGSVPDADVTMVHSTQSKWLMQSHPPLALADGTPDEHAYRGIFDPFYRGAFEAGLQVRIVHPRQLIATRHGGPGTDVPEAVAAHPVLVVPALYVADDESLEWLDAYAAAGGHLVLGPRTGYADHEARARTTHAPDRLTTAAGLSYDEFSNLTTNVSVVGAGVLDLDASAAATRWVDGLEVAGADVLARYDHPHFGRWPAVTSHQHGRGRVTVVGTVPNRALAAALFRHLVPAPSSGWHALPETVTASTSTKDDGRRLHVLHNWSWTDVEVAAPYSLTDLLTGERIPAGSNVALGSWDVRVLASE